MLRLEDLEIYKLANEIAEIIWQQVEKWNHFEKTTLGKQFTRSADSISLNIAEGYGRFSYKENKVFCYYSRGSAFETKNCIEKSFRRNLISPEEYKTLETKLELFLKKLNAYINHIGRIDNQSKPTNV